MVKLKTEGASGYNLRDEFELNDNYSGYIQGELAVEADINRDDYSMRLIDRSGTVWREYDIKWCEETSEYYFVDTSFENVYFRLP